MATEVRGLIPTVYEQGLEEIFGNSYDSIPVMCTQIFDTVNTSKQEWHGQEITGFDTARVKPEAESIQYDSRSPGYQVTIRPVTVGLGFKISREAVDDNQYAETGNANARNLAESMIQFKEIRAANEFNRAFDNTYAKGDGVAMISDAHPTVNGTQANRRTVAADLSEAALEDMHILIQKSRNSRGLKIRVRPRGLVIPTELKFQAQRILKSELRVGTADNDINALRSMNSFPDVMEWEYLEDPKAWFVKTSVPGLHYVNRRGVEFAKEMSFDNEVHKFKATERYEFGSSEWRCIFGSPGV